FQAEDGIRDRNVTGVQTCALPISRGVGRSIRPRRASVCLFSHELKHIRRVNDCSSILTWPFSRPLSALHFLCQLFVRGTTMPLRSEERRVGKECRARWSAVV